MPEHECVIGILLLYDDFILATVEDLKKHIKYRENYNKSLGKEFDWLSKKIWSLKDYADKRKNTNLIRFDYCPECGKKIDWAKIRKEGDI